MKNEYYDIACGDLEYLHFGLASHNYNRISVDAQQVAEKMLKSVLELACPSLPLRITIMTHLFGVFTEDDRENSLCCNPIV